MVKTQVKYHTKTHIVTFPELPKGVDIPAEERKEIEEMIKRIKPFESIFMELETNEVMFNAVRRALIDDIRVNRLHITIGTGDIVSNDYNILHEDIVGTIAQITLSHKLLRDGDKFVLSAQNKTQFPMHVTTDHISWSRDSNGLNAGKNCVEAGLINGNSIITRLDPGCFLNITNISLLERTGREDGLHQLCPPPAFKSNHGEKSALEYEATKFELTCINNGEFTSQQLLDLCRERIREMITHTHQTMIARLKEHEVTNIIELNIEDETHSMGQIFSYYMLQVSPHIGFVAPRVSGNNLTMRIRTDKFNELEKIIEKAAIAAEKDVPTFVKGE